SSFLASVSVFYLQLDGSSMGNPASPVLANLVMDYVLRKIVDSLPFHVPFLKFYVNDTLLAVPGDEVDGLLDHFNKFHEKIQFTMEREQDGELAFLDTIVIRMADGELRTKWFQKPTSSGRLLNFNSHHPLAHKTSVALGSIHRAVALSHSMYHQENLKKVRVILKRNNYPTKFI
ncbi:GSCOCG00008333001-RA-CDS, partial [Cotesia congregata]